MRVYMTDLQTEQLPIDRALFAAVLGSIPRDWTRAALRVRMGPSEGAFDVTIDPLGQPGLATPSDDVFSAVRQLQQLHLRHATGMTAMDCTYERRPDGRWSFAAKYAYGAASG